MDNEAVADACVARRDNEGPSVDNKPDVANEAFVENGVDRFAIKNAALGDAAKSGPLCFLNRHFEEFDLGRTGSFPPRPTDQLTAAVRASVVHF